MRHLALLLCAALLAGLCACGGGEEQLTEAQMDAVMTASRRTETLQGD